MYVCMICNMQAFYIKSYPFYFKGLEWILLKKMNKCESLRVVRYVRKFLLYCDKRSVNYTYSYYV